MQRAERAGTGLISKHLLAIDPKDNSPLFRRRRSSQPAKEMLGCRGLDLTCDGFFQLRETGVTKN
jgi:hypothetical protein